MKKKSKSKPTASTRKKLKSLPKPAAESKKKLKTLPKPLTRFEGSTQDFLDSLPGCVFPFCESPGVHEHHITYDPPVTKPLCRLHHEQITIINGAKGRRTRHSLSNKYRWWIWFQFLKGELKPRRTRKAMEYISDWDRPRDAFRFKGPNNRHE